VNGAREYNHAIRTKRTTRQWCSDVFDRPGELRESFEVRGFPAGFEEEGLFASPTEDEVYFHFGALQFLEKTERVNRAARSGDTDYYSQITLQKIFFVPKLEQPHAKRVEARTDRKL
jgi:hypothetical protein